LQGINYQLKQNTTYLLIKHANYSYIKQKPNGDQPTNSDQQVNKPKPLSKAVAE